MLQYTTGRIPLQFWSMIYLLQLHDRKGGSCFLIQQRLESKRVAVRTWLLSAAQPNTSNNKHVTYQVGKENVVWRRWALPVTVFRWHMCSPSSPELRPERIGHCVSLTPSNVHHASSIASAFNLNQWQQWILVCKTRIEKDVNMTSSHKVMLHVPSECICRKRGWLVKKRYSMRFFCMASTSSRSGGLPSSWSLATNLESSMAPATKCSVSASKSCYRYCGGCRWVSTWIHSLGSTRPSNTGKHTSYQYSQYKYNGD